MELGDLYRLVLLIVVVGMLIGAGLYALAMFSAQVSGAAGTAVNQTITAIALIPSMGLPLIVVIGVLAIVITIVVRSFGGGLGGAAR